MVTRQAGDSILCYLTRAKTAAPVVTHEGTEDTVLGGHNQAFYALNKIESLQLERVLTDNKLSCNSFVTTFTT